MIQGTWPHVLHDAGFSTGIDVDATCSCGHLLGHHVMTTDAPLEGGYLLCSRCNNCASTWSTTQTQHRAVMPDDPVDLLPYRAFARAYDREEGR